MSDDRKSIKVQSGAKYELGVIKQRLGLKSESEAILYLSEFYNLHSERQTLKEHEKLKADVQKLHRQVTM